MSVRHEDFWPQPRWLARALDDGRLRPSEFFLLCYLGGAGLEHYGVPVTQGELARKLNYCRKTIERALHALREAKLVEYELRPGQRTAFRVHAGEALRSGLSALHFRPTTSDIEPTAGPTAGVTSDMTSDIDPRVSVRGDLGHGRCGNEAQTQSERESAPTASLDMGEVDETETETETSETSVTGSETYRLVQQGLHEELAREELAREKLTREILEPLGSELRASAAAGLAEYELYDLRQLHELPPRERLVELQLVALLDARPNRGTSA
jgi:DNA-binding MarR family transcriptional regulator